MVRNPPWVELVQLVPVVSLALPFVLAGSVDLERAGPGFVLGASLTVPVTAAVLWRGHVLNPILVATALWLWVGAVALPLGLEPVASWLADTQAFGLFAASLLVGAAATATPTGYIGARHPDPVWVRRASLGLLGLTLVAVAWAWVFRHDVRLGGGLPFITLNVTRRVLLARA